MDLARASQGALAGSQACCDELAPRLFCSRAAPWGRRRRFAVFSVEFTCTSFVSIALCVPGVTIGIVLIPQGLAYATLAGLPPVYGLYTGLPAVVYAFFGSSSQAAIGPMSIPVRAVIDACPPGLTPVSGYVPPISFRVGPVACVWSGVDVASPARRVRSVSLRVVTRVTHTFIISACAGQDYIDTVLSISLLVGVLLFALGSFHMVCGGYFENFGLALNPVEALQGFLVRFASRPVLAGFTTASALLTIASVMKDLLGVPVARSQVLYTYVAEIAAVLPQTSVPTLLTSILAIGLLLLLPRWRWTSRIPAPLQVGSAWSGARFWRRGDFVYLVPRSGCRFVNCRVCDVARAFTRAHLQRR